MQPEEIAVSVDGGQLRVLRWPGRGPVALAAHGITANALSWALVAEALGEDVSLVAPDLRGRAASAGLPGPYGMTAHARDLVAVLDHLGVADAVLAGHSLGGFAACVTAVHAPDRVRELVLVDGGLGFPVPAGTDIDAVLQAVIGPAMARLAMTFPSREAYRDFWREHPAVGPAWSAAVDAYVQRDLVGTEPELHSSCRLEAIRVDGADVLTGSATLQAIRELPRPATLLWAPRGLFDEPQGLYDEQRLAAAALDPARVRTERVDDVNHYTVLLTDPGARVVADHIRRAAGV
jgi:pimeloyl-ACP methyl ester carboxylesterase